MTARFLLAAGPVGRIRLGAHPVPVRPARIPLRPSELDQRGNRAVRRRYRPA
jgi:hypothetical protein